MYNEPHMNETPFNEYDGRYTRLKSTRGKNQTVRDKKISFKQIQKYLLVLSVAIAIVLVLVLASISLSVAIYGLSSSEQSKVKDQFDRFNATISAKEILRETQCGPGLWYQLMHTNMSDPSQQCPSVWREYNTSGVRVCGRPPSTSGSCSAIVTNLTHIPYSRVCGRIIGFQYGSPDAFRRFGPSHINFDGINITHGVQRDHIWSYLAGATQKNSSTDKGKCPCAGGERGPPQFHHDNYYCESGNTDAYVNFNELYTNDPLWDGQQCEGTCCNGTNSPPWFSVQLPTPTTDGVEVSICCDQGTNNEDVPVQLIELYVQ